ncbi:hypothetical protein Phi40:1_gp034 [Cellulophaga phage phi40:1]|jgi:hypothetical protein|uniref:Uncharacterized protein n=1 Tax=Cellulophaga phage phi38:1 TaxID=1327977 RepID=R9ZXU1_9CAUD|nr:hypothetical protein Phi38:1_gp034 [Cellulophaga phage phi38:1]AGO47899.1 hypothetical protein Phi40:1_gp034 [Cellulophaga phage phi40:1]AGO48064.1 hypothetical protein Phi38:1_gp034 [Cellulophaga phage phi38:1]
MELELYIFSVIYSKYDTEFKNFSPEYQYTIIHRVYDLFKSSEYFPKGTEHTSISSNIVSWIDSLDWRQTIKCECGNWEEFSVDESRYGSQSFKWIKDCAIDPTAYYSCHSCSQYVKSVVRPSEIEYNG